MRTDFIPKHIRIDTAELIDLLVGSMQDVRDLKAFIECDDAPDGIVWDLPGLTDKGDFFKALSHLVPEDRLRSLGDRNTATAFLKTAYWSNLTKLGKHAHCRLRLEHNGMLFNNLIETDGYSVSLNYCAEAKFGKTRFDSGGGRKKEKKVDPFDAPTDLLVRERKRLLNDPNVILIGCDPGKDNLVTFTDGTTFLKYTRLMRSRESCSTRHKHELHTALNRQATADFTYHELQTSLATGSHRSCNTQRYITYLQLRPQALFVLRTKSCTFPPKGEWCNLYA